MSQHFWSCMTSLSSAIKRSGIILTACACVLAASGCANPNQNTMKNTEVAPESDSLEGFNRAMFGFNTYFDKLVLRPITQGYRFVVPEKGRELVSNFLDNIYTPVVFANSVLQADPQNSFASFWRFGINTSFGLGGLLDVASEAGLHNRPADLGETFAFYGVDSGPYIVLPIIGPCDVRDTFGRVGDAFINPFNYVDPGASYVLWTATAIDERSVNMKLIDGVYESSLDPYSTFRSGYTQKRASDIRRAKAGRDKALEKAAAQ